MANDFVHATNTKSELKVLNTKVVEVEAGRGSLRGALIEFWQARHILMFLLKRELRARYKGTVLGNWWIVVRPLIEMLPYVVVFGIFLDLRPTEVPYIVYLLSGFAPWIFLNRIISAAPNMFGKSRSLITKVYFSRLTIPFNSMAVYCIDFCVVFVAVVALGIFMADMGYENLWALPLVILLLLVFGAGAVLTVVSVCTFNQDISYGVPVGLRFLFYMTPIVYPISMVPEEYQVIFQFNPVATIVSSLRWTLFGIDQPTNLALAIAVGFSIFLLALGVTLFLKMERQLVDLL